MTDHQEVLGPRLTKGEARPLETQAKRHYRAAGRNLARFAADLRRLQDGESHLTRGFSSFGAYAEHTFDGLSAANAKKISVQGAILLALEQHDRISLDEQTSQLPGATGLRALGAVMSQHGEDTMLAIYDTASQLRPGRAVVDRTVNLAVHGLLAPPPALDTSAAPDADHDGPPPAAGEVDVDQEPDEDNDPLEDPEAVHELHDRLDEVTPSMLKTFITKLAEQGLAPATVRRYYAPLRAMLGTAYEDDLIIRNPAAGVRVIVKDDRPAKRKRLTADETQRLLAQIPADHADLAYLMAATGLRIGEAFALVWSDFATGKDGPTLTVRESKTEAGRRTIPLAPATIKQLTKRQTAIGARKGDPMFANEQGQALDSHNWRKRVFNPASERAGVPWATPHSLRHGMASLMADHGYSAAQIASHLGHADGGVLAQPAYIHPAAIDVSFLDDVLG